MINANFHHPKDFNQLLIIIFKDIITSEYYPGFYILMLNKTEILYDLVFKAVIRLIMYQNIFKLEFQTITTDTENALINAVTNNFSEVHHLGCWFHLNQDLIREARTMGLFNSKNKKIDTEITYQIISELSILTLQYKRDLDRL